MPYHIYISRCEFSLKCEYPQYFPQRHPITFKDYSIYSYLTRCSPPFIRWRARARSRGSIILIKAEIRISSSLVISMDTCRRWIAVQFNSISIATRRNGMAAFELQMFARAFPFRIIIYYHFSSVNIESARTISDDKQNCLSIFNSLDAWMLRNGLLLFIILWWRACTQWAPRKHTQTAHTQQRGHAAHGKTNFFSIYWLREFSLLLIQRWLLAGAALVRY